MPADSSGLLASIQKVGHPELGARLFLCHQQTCREDPGCCKQHRGQRSGIGSVLTRGMQQ